MGCIRSHILPPRLGRHRKLQLVKVLHRRSRDSLRLVGEVIMMCVDGSLHPRVERGWSSGWCEPDCARRGRHRVSCWSRFGVGRLMRIRLGSDARAVGTTRRSHGSGNWVGWRISADVLRRVGPTVPRRLADGRRSDCRSMRGAGRCYI